MGPLALVPATEGITETLRFLINLWHRASPGLTPGMRRIDWN